MEKSSTKEQYGIAQFNRISACGPNGAPVLFGADVQTNNLICLTISKNATVADDNLMGRRYYPSSKITDNVVEVYMTHAQFADLITNMNIGEGIPVTLRKVHGEKLPEIQKEDVPNIIDAERNTLKEEIQKVAEQAQQSLDKITAILNKPSIGKADRQEIINSYNKLLMGLNDNIPFYIRKAGECVENLVNKAKVELGATAQTAILQAGCAALGMNNVKLISNEK